MRTLGAILAIAWAAPWTGFGLLVGGLGLFCGDTVRRRGRVVEFCGPGVAWFLRTFPLVSGASAITFGHTVLGRTSRDLTRCRKHELVHVRQYERWGPLFVPAYLLYWALLWARGKDPYWDNPFEREARELAGE